MKQFDTFLVPPMPVKLEVVSAYADVFFRTTDTPCRRLIGVPGRAHLVVALRAVR